MNRSPRLAAVLVVCSAFVMAGCAHPAATRPDVATGNPDPGGTRLALLTDVARRGVPSSHPQVTVTRAHWEQGGCDGGPAGWSVIEVVRTLGTTETASATRQLDARLRAMGWSVTDPSSPAPRQTQYPPSAAGAPPGERREYAYHRGRTEAYGWLLAPAQAGGGTSWVLDLVAPPAELPAAEC